MMLYNDAVWSDTMKKLSRLFVLKEERNRTRFDDFKFRSVGTYLP